MQTFSRAVESSIGQKALAAVSGLMLTGWLGLHLLGNFTALSGQVAMDGYAAGLRRLGPLLWLERGALFLALLVHLASALSLSRRGFAARPVRSVKRWPRGNPASRLMVVGGPLLLGFVIFHLLHMTFGVVHPAFVPGHVYANLVTGLASAGVTAVYVGAAGLVALHLHHGLTSAFVSVGVDTSRERARRRNVGGAVAIAFGVGFALIPVAAHFGALP